MQLRLRQQLIDLWSSSFLFVSVTLGATHVGQWPRLHGSVTDGVTPQRKRDKDWGNKTQEELSDRESIRKWLQKNKTVGRAFAAVLIRPSETSFSSATHAHTPAAVCDCVILHFSALSARLWSPPPPAPPPFILKFPPSSSHSDPSCPSQFHWSSWTALMTYYTLFFPYRLYCLWQDTAQSSR